jgi:hypothetical protein
MEYDADKVDEMTLALMYLTMTEGGRTWKGYSWDAMDRLHEKGFIFDPKKKTKSVAMTDEGLRRSEELFRKYFM